jgi:hypothetical protein
VDAGERDTSALYQMRTVAAAIAAFFAWLGADFLVHAGALAPWWRATADFWHPPADLFRLIPFAYLSFALTSIVLVWLVIRLEGPRPRPRRVVGLGAGLGLFLGISSALANYSVVPMPVSTLLVWPASYLSYTVAAGAAVAYTLGAEHPWRRVAIVFGLALVLCIIGIVLQNMLVA